MELGPGAYIIIETTVSEWHNTAVLKKCNRSSQNWSKMNMYLSNSDEGKIIMLANITQQSSYAIGWGTLALINAGLAQSKNRSGIAWFLVSLLLGPIATFFIVIVESIAKK